MDKWAEKLFEFHRHPVKVTFPAFKNYLPVNQKKEKTDVDEGLTAFHKILEVERVDRRCARLEGIWLEDSKLIKVTRTVGYCLRNFGFQNKTGRYLYPEEAMYLLETNRLEILWNNVSMSIQQAFSVILNSLPVHKYFAYRKLVSEGFKLIIPSEQNKRKLEENSSPESKRICCKERQGQGSSSVSTSATIVKTQQNVQRDLKENFTEIFQKLKQIAPKRWTGRTNISPDYNALMPNNTKEGREMYSTYICDINEFDPRWGLLETSANLFGFVQNDGVAFYRFGSVDISVS